MENKCLLSCQQHGSYDCGMSSGKADTVAYLLLEVIVQVDKTLMVKLYKSVAPICSQLALGHLQLTAVKLTGGGVFQTREAILRCPFGVCNSCCSFPRLKSFLLCSSSRIRVCTSFIHCRHTDSLHLVIWHHWGMLR